jgi:hypothetical protein
MSCLEELKARGIPYYKEHNAIYVEPTRTSNCRFLRSNTQYIAMLMFEPNTFKRIKVRYHIKVSNVGTTFESYRCATGFGLLRLALYTLDPMQRVAEAIFTLMNIIVAIELLRSLVEVI